jgi:hypothetical protein
MLFWSWEVVRYNFMHKYSIPFSNVYKTWLYLSKPKPRTPFSR